MSSPHLPLPDSYEGLLSRAQFYQAMGPCYEVLYGQDIGVEAHVVQGLRQLRANWC